MYDFLSKRKFSPIIRTECPTPIEIIIKLLKFCTDFINVIVFLVDFVVERIFSV